MYTVYFYLKDQTKDSKTFKTLQEAGAFMMGLYNNPDCECYGIHRERR